ncbi:MAG: hypothetical protein KAR33_01570 [Candidatus Thorarchaeota archaeon]|nr:hypothetical protein [Candidatus Thorarchaeota archaeon]
MEKKSLKSDEWVISGSVTYSRTRRPAVGVGVTAMDADFLFDDKLGETTTNKDGKFKISYTSKQFRDILECAPDVYLLIHDKEGSLLTTTHDSVVRNAGPKLEIHVQLLEDDLEPPTPTLRVRGVKINKKAYDALSVDDIKTIAKDVMSKKSDEKSLEILRGLNPDVSRIFKEHPMSSTPIVELIYEIMELKALPRLDILSIVDILNGMNLFVAATTYSCPPFDINYEVTGATAVDTTDSASDIVIPGTTIVVGTTSANGVPDFIERVCFWLQRALQMYNDPPFSLRAPFGGNTITVNINDANYGNANRSGIINLQHDLNDDMIAAVLVHELFHMVQFEYETSGSSGLWSWGIREGGAILAEDCVMDPINRYIGEADDWGGNGILKEPEGDISQYGRKYKVSLLIKYITEQLSSRVYPGDEPLIGVETYRTILETCDSDGYTTDAFEKAIRDLPWYQNFFKFAYLDPAQLDRTNSETLLGNFWLACYLKDLGANVPDRRFEFMEDEETSLIDDICPTADAPAGSIDTLRSVTLHQDTILGTGTTVTLSSGNGGSVDPFAARFYKVSPDAGVNTLKVSFTASSGFTRPIVQIALVDSGNTVRDIFRSDRMVWNQTIANDKLGTKLDHVIIVVAGTDVGGSFGISVQDVSAAPDVTITRWNTALENHYQIDSFGWSHTWTSPDIWVDTNQDGIADDEVYFNKDNKLYAQLHNQGNADANNIQVEFWYQDASGGLRDSDWIPVKDKAGTVQTLTGLSLAAQTSNKWFVNWAPEQSGSSHHFCVRVVVTAQGDPNIDNKRSLNNFGNVVVSLGFFDITLVRHGIYKIDDIRIQVIPRFNKNFLISECDLKRINETRVPFGKTVVDELRVWPIKIKDRISKKRKPRDCNELLKKQLYVARPEQTKVEHIPDLRGHYPADPRTLPPGLEEAELVTIAQVVNNEVIGGFTWAIRRGKK